MVLHRWVGEYNWVILCYQLSLENLQNYKGQHPPLLFLKKTREDKKKPGYFSIINKIVLECGKDLNIT